MLAQIKKNLVITAKKAKNFFKDEKSDNTTTSNGMWVYVAFILGLIILVIASEATDLSFNGMFNSFQDGTSGKVDESGLNQWSDKTNGYDRVGN